MVKESITPQDVCDLLNELLKLDPECANALFSHRIKCNEAVANHPTIQVLQSTPFTSARVGFLGLLNGMFGVKKNGLGVICIGIDDDKLIDFKVIPDKTNGK
jgi:hypothetical protein